MLILRVLVALGETEVDNINVVLRRFCSSNQEVVWLNIAVNNSFFVDLLDSLDLF